MSRPKFMPVDTYVRYFDFQTRSFKYTYLLERRSPIYFPFRFAPIAPGTEGIVQSFDNLRPDTDEDHIMQSFLGLYPEMDYKLLHPFNVRQNQLDERIDQIANEDLAQILKYDDSPHDAPQLSIWLDEQRYPGIQPRNVGRRTVTTQVDFVSALYRVIQDSDIESSTKSKLVSGEIKSVPIDFGGEI